MRIVNEGPIVCGSRISQESPSTTHFDQTVPDTCHSGPFDTFTLGVPANASLMLTREGGGMDAEGAVRSGLVVHSAPIKHAQSGRTDDEYTRGSLSALPSALEHVSLSPQPPTITPADIPVQPVSDPRIPHGSANQPATSKLLKTFPSSIRTRVRSFTDAEPLAFRWKFPANKRYRVKDEEAFAALREKNIEWYVTTGLLIEDHLGLKWVAGDYTYLLYWHADWMPAPDDVDKTHRSLHIRLEFIREWQVGKWEADFACKFLEDRPATPIVEDSDPMSGALSPLERAKSPTNTPCATRGLPLRPRSALSKHQVQEMPASPLSVSSCWGSGSPDRLKRVRLHREKKYRTVELTVDDTGIPVEEEGKLLETMFDEMTVLTDNEGKTVRSWLGLG